MGEKEMNEKKKEEARIEKKLDMLPNVNRPDEETDMRKAKGEGPTKKGDLAKTDGSEEEGVEGEEDDKQKNMQKYTDAIKKKTKLERRLKKEAAEIKKAEKKAKEEEEEAKEEKEL